MYSLVLISLKMAEELFFQENEQIVKLLENSEKWPLQWKML